MVTRKQRVEWILAHENLWRGYDAGSLSSIAKHHDIVRAMQSDGIVSKKTRWQDVDVRGLVIDARMMRRERHWEY